MGTAFIPPLSTVESQIDDLLARIGKELQLDDTRYALADTSYNAVGTYLDRHPVVGRFKPTIYSQGSMRLNTTVKPLTGEEYDLDFVCEFLYPSEVFARPVQALDLIESAMRQSDRYRPMVERKNRCICLNYQHEFHMDILPACPDTEKGGTCIVVPDRKLSLWTPSNPKGYASWFDFQSHRRSMAFDKAEPLPSKEPIETKAILKICVQLIKRRRDIIYKDNCNIAPISIVLTTLAASCYQGEESVARALNNILTEIEARIRASEPGRLVVFNPQNTSEDLSERWTANPQLYREFAIFIREFRTKWTALLATRGVHRVTEQLEALFGEELAKTVVEKQTRDLEAARSRQGLGVLQKTGIVSGVATGATVAIRPNTFYGEGK
jgi:Second Messenger Oligonucleotide or Dinucleotide Synthetase domain